MHNMFVISKSCFSRANINTRKQLKYCKQQNQTGTQTNGGGKSVVVFITYTPPPPNPQILFNAQSTTMVLYQGEYKRKHTHTLQTRSKQLLILFVCCQHAFAHTNTASVMEDVPWIYLHAR